MYGGINELMVEEVADDLHEEGGGRDGGEGQDGGPLKARCWPPAQSQSNSPALQKKGSKVSTKATTTPNATTTNHPHRGTNSATRGAKHTARGPGDAEGVHPVTQQAIPHQYHSTTKLADKYAPPGLKIEETTRQGLDR